MPEQQSIVADLVEGAIAGAIATWLMGKVTTLMYEREDESARAREDAARHGTTSYEVAAEKLAGAVERPLAKSERQRYGQVVHWGLGIGAGAAYAVLRNRAPRTALGRGLAFGAAFWLVMDEVLTPALGLTPGPRAFPWQTHARGLAGHLALGATADATLSVMNDAM